jgi:hypothetical protein
MANDDAKKKVLIYDRTLQKFYFGFGSKNEIQDKNIETSE